ncbi:MAG TPA: DUF86 domain-containing protein [Thermoanaerobaculia bacterium]|nr:DUF86 domain-containing protein [Thermoanaerobaculia bacterium]
MVRPEIARHKIASASMRLEQAETLVSRSREQFLADPRGRDLASFYLMLAIQDVIDLAAHWVADAGWPMPTDAASTFGLIADQGAIDRELADGLRAAVGLRNRIAHGYGTLDHARLHDEFSRGVATLRRFLAAVAVASGM